MKILITGVAGFIGSNLASFLLEKNLTVLGIDNFSQGGKEAVKSLSKYKNFTFCSLDLTKSKSLQPIVKGLDVIIHLAAKKIPRYENSLRTLKENTQITELMLEEARKNNAKFIFASTSDVYGLNRDLPFKENSNLVIGPPTVSRWAYAVSKIYDEHISFAYSDKYKFPVVVLRFFGVYGPGVNLSWWGGPFGPFIDSILSNKTVEIHGDGEQIRCFTYIDDIIRGIYLSIVSKKSEGQILNVASDEPTSIIGLARKIEKISVKKAKFKFIPYSTFYGGNYQDVIVKIPDIKKAQDVINFKANISLEEGIKRTLDWYLSAK